MAAGLKVAVITLTRDRVDYTRHCFASLEKNAGIPFDWYVVDNASTDGALDYINTWASGGNGIRTAFFSRTNMGICAAANHALLNLGPENYDVVCRFDNDCEVTKPDTLKICAELAAEYGVICSPHVLGLRNPPPSHRQAKVGDWLLDETTILGGIFMAIPSFLFWSHGYRYDETHSLASGDEAIVPFWRSLGGTCGYVHGLTVNHYETSEGQLARYPEYEQRKVLEMAGVPPQLHPAFTGNVTSKETVYDRGASALSVVRDAVDAEFPIEETVYKR